MPKTPETPDCEICRKVALAHSGQNPNVIHEFEHSFLVVGDHQFFPGYAVLLSKTHVREPFDFEPLVQQAMFRELMISARAVQSAYKPLKMNYACYGNQVPHLHWHLFPRYESDPQNKMVPWVHSAEFEQHLTNAKQARDVAIKIAEALCLDL